MFELCKELIQRNWNQNSKSLALTQVVNALTRAVNPWRYLVFCNTRYNFSPFGCYSLQDRLVFVAKITCYKTHLLFIPVITCCKRHLLLLVKLSCYLLHVNFNFATIFTVVNMDPIEWKTVDWKLCGYFTFLNKKLI